jgi:hypothetical protein
MVLSLAVVFAVDLSHLQFYFCCDHCHMERVSFGDRDSIEYDVRLDILHDFDRLLKDFSLFLGCIRDETF